MPEVADKPAYQEKYGVKWKPHLDPLSIELLAFSRRMGNGRLFHLKQVIAMCWPDRIWHDWTERRMDGLDRYDFVSWAGAASTGKTDDAALYAMAWWLSDPLNSTVILTSTTAGMIRKRAWSSIQRLYWGFCADNKRLGLQKYIFPGDLLDSVMTLRAQFPDGRKDHKSALFAKAVKEGNTSKAAADIQGIHNRRILVIIDEATETPPAIFDVLPNLMAGAKEFQLIVIANPASRLDQHGRFSEPLKGWNSVGIDDEEWETVVQLNGKPGLCQRFDGEKCPNVIEPRAEYRFLMSRNVLEGYRSKLGPRDPRFWKWARGFWPPSGTCITVMDELDVMQHGGMDKVTYLTRRTAVAGLDPGFGGDDCVLVLGSVGDVQGISGSVIQIEQEVIVQSDATSKESVDYQIAHQVMALCKAANVRPENFACDSTGTGRGVFAVLHEEWSNRIKRVEFGGAASNLPAAEDDTRPGKEVYDRRVTELWFSARTLLRSGRLKGLSLEIVREFTNRTYDTKRDMVRIQTKEEMRGQYGRSPDHADAVAVLIDGVRQSGYAGRFDSSAGGGEAWRKQVELANRVYEGIDFAEERD